MRFHFLCAVRNRPVGIIRQCFSITSWDVKNRDLDVPQNFDMSSIQEQAECLLGGANIICSIGSIWLTWQRYLRAVQSPRFLLRLLASFRLDLFAKSGRQEVVDLVVVDQAKLSQDFEVNRSAGQFLYREKLVYVLEDLSMVNFVQVDLGRVSTFPNFLIFLLFVPVGSTTPYFRILPSHPRL